MALTVGTNSYIDADDADLYFADALHADEWAASTVPTKEKALVTATRMLDRQRWVGTKTASDQGLMWPRTGITDAAGTAVDSTTVPQAVLDATCELALSLIEDQSVQTQPNTGSNISEIQAGPVNVKFFATRTSGAKFPVIVHELIGSYLSGSSYPLPFVSGTDVESELGDYGLSRGYDA